MSVLDWKTYMEACEENQLVDLTQLEADKSVKEDILRRTKMFINRILEGELE